MPPRSSIALLLGQQVDDGIRRLGIHLRRVRAVEPDDVPRELGDRDVHAEADAEVRDLALARDAAGEDLPLPAARAEAAGDEHAVDRARAARRVSSYDMFSASTQRTRTRAAVVQPGVLQRLVHGEVGVLQLHVLADERDLDELAARVDALRQLGPLAEVDVGGLEAELLADEPVEALLLEHLGHEVDVGHVGARDDGAGIDVGEERDLVADVARQLLVRAADDHVGMDTDAAQLVDRVLRRLRLQLAGGLDERHERHVDVHDVLGADLAAELAHRLEERQRLDVADGAADLGDDDVGRARLCGARGCAP